MTLAAVAVIYTKLSSIFSFRPVRLYTLSDRSARPVVRSLGQADESGRRSERVNASSDRSSRLWADRSGRRSHREKRPVIRLGFSEHCSTLIKPAISPYLHQCAIGLFDECYSHNGLSYGYAYVLYHRGDHWAVVHTSTYSCFHTSVAYWPKRIYLPLV